jgi:hypothetical protein
MVFLPRCVNPEVYESSKELAKACITKNGFCELKNFILPEYVNDLLEEAEALKSAGFQSYDTHNLYLESNTGSDKNTSLVEDPRAKLKETSFGSGKTLVNQQKLPKQSLLLELYNWEGLKELQRIAFYLPELHQSADPLGGVYYNYFEKGQQLGWHFDRSEYSMNLIIQEPDPATGGQFVYLPFSRDVVDKWIDFPTELSDLLENSNVFNKGYRRKGNPEQSFEVHTTINEGYGDCERRLKFLAPHLEPGSLYLFAGNLSLHCVTKVNGNTKTRINAIFTYNRKPNETLNEYTRIKFFGE